MPQTRRSHLASPVNPPPLSPSAGLTRAPACLRPASHSDEAGQNVWSEILTPALPPPPLYLSSASYQSD